jgi:hypothetical protein
MKSSWMGSRAQSIHRGKECPPMIIPVEMA